MFLKKIETEPTMLEEAIEKILIEMKDHRSDSDEYAKMADQLDKLYKLKDIDRPKQVSPDTLATIAANITGILMIISHERVHIVTSKALGFVTKLTK